MNWLFYIFIFLMPFYFLPSGLPQIADFVMVIFIIMSLLKMKWYKSNIVFIILIFLLYIIIINFSHIYINNEINPLIYNIYYLYNFLILFTVYNFFKNIRFKEIKTVYFIFLLTIIMQFLITLFVNDSGLRATNFFNNPNQLGYFILTLTAGISIVSFRLHHSISFHFIPYIFSFYTILMSGSRGAIIGLIVVFIAHYLLLDFSLKKIMFLVSFIALILGIYQFKDLFLSDYPVLHNLITRILEPFDESDVLSDRGYQRIFDYPQYLLFGAGEGYSARIGGGIELHSLPGTVLFSYGIIGATIFIFLMIRIIFLMKFHVLLLLGIFLYNLSHNGLRFTILWVVIAIIIAFYEKENSAK